MARFLTILFLLTSSSLVWAGTSSNSNLFLPAVDGSPYLTVNDSRTLRQWDYHFGAFFNYAKNPLEVGLAGARQTGVINQLLMGNFFGAVGILDWLQLGLDAPVGLLEDITLPDATLTKLTAIQEKTIKLSDIRFEVKFKIFDIDQKRFGVSVMPYLLAPTGSSDHLLGNGKFGGGLRVIGDARVTDRIQVSLNMGYLVRSGVVVLNTVQDDQFSAGLGVNFRAMPWMDVLGEMSSSTNVNNFYGKEAESPLEFDAGVRFFLPKPTGLAVTVGGGVGLTFGYGTPNYRLLAGLTYPNSKRIAPPPPPPPAPIARIERRKIVISKKVHFEFDKAVIRPISFPILDAVADALKRNPGIHKVRIEGHTDAKGGDAYNLRLSQKRTDAVKEYFVAHGIDADRLVAVGYGESRSIDTNDTPEGRAKNRRVEFTILEQEGPAPAPEAAPQ